MSTSPRGKRKSTVFDENAAPEDFQSKKSNIPPLKRTSALPRFQAVAKKVSIEKEEIIPEVVVPVPSARPRTVAGLLR